LSEKKKESVTDKKISRRSMLKWTGGLAAAAVVGGAVVYGATYKAPPPPPPSFKPPLSADVQTTVDGMVKDMIARHAGETLVYGNCTTNCAGSACLYKYHVKNGVVTAIEPDDTHHPNVGREDSVMTQQDFDWGLFNRSRVSHRLESRRPSRFSGQSLVSDEESWSSWRKQVGEN